MSDVLLSLPVIRDWNFVLIEQKAGIAAFICHIRTLRRQSGLGLRVAA